MELNKNVKLYLADPAEVQKYLIENKICGVTLTRRETSFIWEDYAIFDKQIAFKHDSKNSLYLGMRDQISEMLLPFKLLDLRPQIFEKIYMNGIYKYDEDKQDWCIRKYNWDEFKKNVYP